MTYHNLTALATRHPLVLGSGSPRRMQLLGEIGIPFTQRIPDIHESIRQGEAPYDYALRLAEEKALVTAMHLAGFRLMSGRELAMVSAFAAAV